jgi:hypothetical protein
VGLAIASTTFNTVFSRNLHSAADVISGPLSPLSDANQAIAFIPHLRELHSEVSRADLHRILGVYLQGFRIVFYVMTGISGIGFITSLFAKELSLKNREHNAQAFEEK